MGQADKGTQSELTAAEIKQKLMAAKTSQGGPVEPCEFAGVSGWLFLATAYQMEQYRAMANSDDADVAAKAPSKLIQVCFRDHSGVAVFAGNELAIIAGFLDRDHAPVFRSALRINGYGPQGGEQLVKNLLTILGADGFYDLLARLGAPCPKCSTDGVPGNSASNT